MAMGQEADATRDQILTPSEPTAQSSGSNPQNRQPISGTAQVLIAQDELENEQQERMSGLTLSPDMGNTSCEGGSDRTLSNVTYTINFSKQEGVSYHKKKMSEEEFQAVKEHDAQCVFEVTKDVQMFEKDSNDNNKVRYVLAERIFVYSPRLLRAVKEVITYWPSMEFFNSSNKRLEMTSPYIALCSYRKEFEEYVGKMRRNVEELQKLGSRNPMIDDNKATIAEVTELMKVVNKSNDSLVNEEIARHGREHPMATFDMLWLLFRPGDFVYAKISGVEIACRVQVLVWQGKEIEVDPSAGVTFHLWYLDFNGSEVDRRCHEVEMIRFKGEQRIRDLDVYPEKYAEDATAKREALEARGKRYFELLANTTSYCSYKGTFSTDDYDPYDKKEQRWYEGKVIIDPARYARENGIYIAESEWKDDTDTRWTQGGEKFKSFVKINPKDTACVPTKEHYILTPPYIRGFTLDAMDQRQWVFLEVTNIQPYKQEKHLIDTLSIDPEDIKMIKAVTPPSPATENFNADKVPGKGEGDVILLWGPPGTGKTYTTECIAEWSGRPLLRLTCAELGVHPHALESRLFVFFQRAEEWNAIVLMDECDIYISRRSSQGSFEKNAMVSVFLRALDYFKGTIFLTTNHSFEIDRAIIDRITLTVQYKKQKEVRSTICNNLQHSLIESGYFLSVEAHKELDKLCADDYEWSGREINSVFNLVTKRTRYNFGGEQKLQIDGKQRLRIDGTTIATVMERVKTFENEYRKANGTTLDGHMRQHGSA